ncbi:MAG TPA: NAD-dependent epimerase/dehydratase family protein [Anaerolineales bacterium]|nr:NAD-dependent epimerase/dehydratase family protein [Anaerolineales bacterium]
MILVTGGTGFIGRALVRHLIDLGYPIRLLLRPSQDSPGLPLGVSLDVSISSLDDPRGLQSAMTDVDTIFHLASAEHHGASGDLLKIDIQGTESVVAAAADAGVERFIYLSHLGADRASAFPVMKSKAIAEEHIRRSGIPYTILRSGLVYGPGDSFTGGLAQMLHAVPWLFLVPGDGRSLVQPLWVEDLATCLAWAVEDQLTVDQTLELGGPEHITFFESVQSIMTALGLRRSLVSVKPPYLRAFTVLLEHILPGFPVSVYWLDYLAANHTCALDTIPRVFGLMPSRFSYRIDYLQNGNWSRHFWRTVLRRRSRLRS